MTDDRMRVSGSASRTVRANGGRGGQDRVENAVCDSRYSRTLESRVQSPWSS